jgi:hypothetical protein
MIKNEKVETVSNKNKVFLNAVADVVRRLWKEKKSKYSDIEEFFKYLFEERLWKLKCDMSIKLKELIAEINDRK